MTDFTAWCNIDFVDSIANPLYYAHNLYLNGELVRDLVIPNGVTEIKNYAFYNCSSLVDITVLNGAKTIGKQAFSGCCNVEKLYIKCYNKCTWVTV